MKKMQSTESTVSDFAPTHEFTLENDERVLVRVEFRSDYVGFEADGTTWYTVMGPEALWWSCRARNVTRIKAVTKLPPRPEQTAQS